MMRLGIIGCGRVVQDFHMPVLSFLQSKGMVDVVWTMDENMSASRLVAKSLFAQAIPSLTNSDSVDAIFIAIPVGAREVYLQKAYEYGWHMFLEKPIAVEEKTVDEIISYMERERKIVSCGMMRREYAGVQTFRELITSEILGKPVKLWAAEAGLQRKTGQDEKWYQSSRSLAGGGILIETGSHLLDQVVFLLNPKNVKYEGAELKYGLENLEYEANIRCTFFSEKWSNLPVRLYLSNDNYAANGIYIQFEQILARLGTGPSDCVELVDNSSTTPFSLVNREGAKTSGEAFASEWIGFFENINNLEIDGALKSIRKTKLTTHLIEACYTSEISKN
jgi:predicted dehydrogenase